MAIINFKNSSDLINYLCQEDVMGDLQVSFTQKQSSILEASFNFDYPELEKHLDMIFLDWPGFYGSTTSAIYINFENSEDYSVNAEDDMQWSDYNLSEAIYSYVRDLILHKYGVDSYLLISLEGTGFTLEEIDVKKMEIHKSEGKEELIELDENTKTTILNGILDILSDTRTSIDSLDKFTLENTDGIDNVYYCIEGSPDAYDYYDLNDGEWFSLDTDVLQVAKKSAREEQ
jgi:hypothetical protein